MWSRPRAGNSNSIARGVNELISHGIERRGSLTGHDPVGGTAETLVAWRVQSRDAGRGTMTQTLRAGVDSSPNLISEGLNDLNSLAHRLSHLHDIVVSFRVIGIEGEPAQVRVELFDETPGIGI